MRWEEIRQQYPHQWLLVEATEAYSVPGRRIVEELEVVGTYPDGGAAMKGYGEMHRREPLRELFVIHTDRETIEIEESIGWLQETRIAS
jgi:hypothetical protein